VVPRWVSVLGRVHAFPIAFLLAVSCDQSALTSSSDTVASVASGALGDDSAQARSLRVQLVSSLLVNGDLVEGPVADAMRRVPRHAFVPDVSLEEAYANLPLPIGFGQTISQPAVVAIMTQSLDIARRNRVLEIGTGSGYQAAILGLLSRDVFTIEIVAPLADRARSRLAGLGYSNVHVRTGDGYAGWPEQAPFDRIMVTAAPAEVPHALLDQLAQEGILVAPVGRTAYEQRLLRYRKSKDGLQVEDLGPVAFVPLVPAKRQ
jgi:protein-L-isoaspartate(D-aspartate) O-methyltransferase